MTDVREQLLREINDLNKEYFGTSSILPGDKNPSQLARYKSAVITFWSGQKNSLIDYLTEQNWNVTNKCDTEGFGNIIGEKDSVRVTFSTEYKNAFGIMYFLIIENSVGESRYKKSIYLLDVISDFIKNPHYEPEVPDVRYPYRNTEAVPRCCDKLEVWVDEVRNTVEHNRKLGKNYNFRLTAGLWDGIDYNPTGDNYVNLVGLIKMLVDHIESN